MNKAYSGNSERQGSYTMITLLAFRFLNLALAYILIIVVSKYFSASEYILFEKITFFLMSGNILLSPFLISMWHERVVEHLVIEGLLLLASLSLMASLLLYLTTSDIMVTVAVGAILYFFCYYLKSTLYTHLITLKSYYRAYSTNSIFYIAYMIAMLLLVYGSHLHSYLVSFLAFPSLFLITIFLIQWKALLNGENDRPVKEKKKFREIFSVAILGHNLMTLLLSSGERFILEGFSSVGEERLAAFLYLATIVSAFQSLGLSLGEWLRPQVFERMSEGCRLSDLYSNAIYVLLALFLVFLFAGWPVLLFISPDKMMYFSFFPYFSLLALSHLLLVLTFFLDLQIVYRKRYLLLLLASSLAVTGKALGYYLWDGLEDLSGVVFANVLGASIFLISMIFFIRLSYKEIPDAEKGYSTDV